MKCSHCYSDNSAWATVCVRCGQSVLRLEICPNGHLLPPGVQECPICPSLWPDVEAFAGPPLLRGFLWVESGRLATASFPEKVLAYVEIRDREIPFELRVQPSGAVFVADDDGGEAQVRILMRPDGVRVCNKIQTGRRSGPLSYTTILPGESFELGTSSFRYLKIQPPNWVEKLAREMRS